MRIFLGSLLLAAVGTTALGQARTTVQPGPWNVGATWSGGVVPTSSNSTSITVAHNVNIPSGFTATVDQTTVNQNVTLTVDAGGILTVVDDGTLEADLDLFNDGVNFGFLSVLGEMNGNNLATFDGTSALNVSFGSASIYHHRWINTEGSLPIAAWNATSTVEINGYKTSIIATAGGNWGQNFGHFKYNCTGQPYTSTVNFAGLLTSIGGNFTVSATNGGPSSQGKIILAEGESPTVTIGGNLTIEGASRFYASTAPGTTTLNIGGNFVVTTNNNKGFGLSSGGTTLATVANDFTLNASGGRFDLAISGGSATLDVKGDFEFQAGSFNGTGTLRFSGTTTQLYSAIGTFSGVVNYDITSTATLDLGTSAIGGGGSFTLSGTLRLGSTEPQGAIVNNESLGNVRTPVATRTFSNGSRIVYAGSAAQFMGLGHPSTSGVIAEISNSSGVSLAAPVTLGGNLVLTTGNLSIGAQTLTLNAGQSATGGSLAVTSSSNLVINGSGAFGNVPLQAGAQSIRNLTINRTAGSVTLVNPVTITNILTLTTGNLVFNGQQLTLSGTLSRTAGVLQANSSSTLIISGSGALGSSLLFSGSGNSVGTLTMNKTSGSATVSGTLTVVTSLNLLAGNLSNAGGLLLANAGTITRDFGVLQTNRVFNSPGEFYDVTYTNTADLVAGFELPDPANTDDLRNLTMSGSGAVRLNQNLTINGTASFDDGDFQVGLSSPTIFMQGPSWSVGPGLFTRASGATGTVVFNGNTTIGGSGNITFHHVTVNNGASVTMPGGTASIAGNLTVSAGATFTANNGTVAFNGTSNQSVNVNGADFKNITVTKTGGAVTLTSGLDLFGVLLVSSATTVNSDGFLTVVSTSDGATGNGSIGQIVTGGKVESNVNVQRFMSDEGRINRYISIPMEDVPVSQLQDDYSITGSFTGTSFPCDGCGTQNATSLKYYDETVPGDFALGYSSYPKNINTETFLPGRGYLAFMWEAAPDFPKVVNQDITGVIIQGDFTYSPPILTFTSSPAGINHDGWNLLGNPYPSSIQWEDLTDLPGGWTTTNIDPTVFVPDNGAGGVFRSYNRATNVGDLTNGVIAQGQSFWLKANAASPAITVTESAKSSATGVFFRRRSTVATNMMVSLSHKGAQDNSFLVVHDQASGGYDDGLDALKFQALLPEMAGPEFDIALLGDRAERLVMYAHHEFVEGLEIPLSLRVTEPGEYRISFSNMEGFPHTELLHLYDAYLQEYMPVEAGKSYPVLLTSAGTNSDRFKLTFGAKEKSEAMARVVLLATPNPASDNLDIYVTTDIAPQVQLMDVTGRVIVGNVEMNPSDAGFKGTINVGSFQQGIYIVRAMTAEGIVSSRVIKK